MRKAERTEVSKLGIQFEKLEKYQLKRTERIKERRAIINKKEKTKTKTERTKQPKSIC